MLERPRFKNSPLVEVIEPDQVVLISEAETVVLKGRLAARLAPFLDGQHTVSDIAKQFHGQLGIADIRLELSLLAAAGFLVETDPAHPSWLAAFCDFLNLDPQLFHERLRSARVAVRSVGPISEEPFASILQSLQIRVGDEGNFGVVLTDDYLHPDLSGFNRRALANKQLWMLVRPVGLALWIGPIFRPRQTGCWACLAQRLRATREVQGSGPPTGFPLGNRGLYSPPALPSTWQVALNWAGNEVLKWIVQGGHSELEGKLITLDPRSLRSMTHTLIRNTVCPECAELQKVPPPSAAPLLLESREKLFTSDGGHRSARPEETFEKYACHISPITGVVGTVKPNLEDRSGLVHVYAAGHNFTIRQEQNAPEGRRLIRNSVGKGMTRSQARTSALCEALERYSGIFRGDEPRLRATLRTLGGLAVPPNACMLFSQQQYEDRDTWNEREAEFNWIPQPFDPEREVEWTPVWSLTNKQMKYVPTAYCYYGYPYDSDHDFCRADSNGNAAGSSLEDAILQGFLEVVERDCVALWWYNRIRRPAVKLEDFPQPYFSALRGYYRSLGREIWVLDITNDFEIPAFVAVSKSTRPGKHDYLLGLGAHFDAQLAISRALTEMNQFLPALLRGRARKLYTGSLPNYALLRPWESSPRKLSADFPRRCSNNLRDDIETCVDRASRIGLEVLVLDQTRSEVELPVVKVFLPGARPFWPRFGPGRLYDVPVRLGWLPTPWKERKLNAAHLRL